MRVTANSAAQFGVCSGLLGGIEGGWSVGTSASIDAGENISAISTSLSFLDRNGAVLLSTEGGGLAPAGTAFIRFCIQASTLSAGAVFIVQTAMISAVAPATATATSTATTTATTTATVTATATSTGTSTPIATSTPPATATATAAPPPPSVRPSAEGLRNPGFELGGGGTPMHWDIRRGSATASTVAGASGRAAVISSGSSTSWIEQLIPAQAGAWYEATARLAPLDAVSAGWVRIAWYATADGSGGQTSTEDSPNVEGSGDVWVTVSTGAVQAPEGTRSARVRILARPGDGQARLGADDVTFDETTAPVPASSTPMSTVTPTATPTQGAAATPTATPPLPTTPTARSTAASSTQVAEATPGGPIERVRITEVLADPAAPGNDAPFEWVELTNYGDETV